MSTNTMYALSRKITSSYSCWFSRTEAIELNNEGTSTLTTYMTVWNIPHYDVAYATL